MPSLHLPRGYVQVSRDMGTLVAEGINSFKFFMAYKVRREAAGKQPARRPLNR